MLMELELPAAMVALGTLPIQDGRVVASRIEAIVSSRDFCGGGEDMLGMQAS